MSEVTKPKPKFETLSEDTLAKVHLDDYSNKELVVKVANSRVTGEDGEVKEFQQVSLTLSTLVWDKELKARVERQTVMRFKPAEWDAFVNAINP